MFQIVNLGTDQKFVVDIIVSKQWTGIFLFFLSWQVIRNDH